MKTKSSDANVKFSASIFRSFTITIVLTIVVLSGILHFYFEDIALKQTYDSTMNNLAQTSQEASIMAVNARTFAKQIYNDIQVSKLLYFQEGDPIDTGAAMAQLSSYRATSPFIDSIYIYNYRTDTFYTSADISANSVWKADEFYDTTAARMVKNLSDYEPLMPIPRKIPFESLKLDNLEKERDCYTFVLYDTLSHNKAKNAIFVNISETQMHKNIDGMIVSSEKNTFIIDNKGILITNSWKDEMLTDLSGRPYIRKVLDNATTEGYFVTNADGVKSLVTYTSPDFLGWRYIRIVPYNVINSSINKMRIVTTAIALAILIAGLLLSFLISRRLSSNVKAKLAKLTTLEMERRNHTTALRQDLIRNLLLGSGCGHPASLHEKFEAYHIKLDAASRFSVCVLKIDQFKQLGELYSNEDRNLFRIGVMNIVQELLSPVCPCFVVDMGDDRIAVLLSIRESVPDIRDILPESVWEHIQESIESYIRLSVSIAISTVGDDVWSVSRLYAQAGDALFYRMFYGFGCIVYADRIEELKAKPYVYPLSKEKQLIEELMLGRTTDAERLFRDIVLETAGFSYMSFHLAISHLAFAVNSAVTTIRKNNDISLGLNIGALLSCLNEAETLETICSAFYNVFQGVAAGLEEKKNAKHDEVVGKIITIVQTKYMLTDLSLDSIADEMGLSATYIGRLFKKSTLGTILNYIIEVRMEKARELLATTELPIGDIAERTGFSNSPYFYKAFKKMNGVTPADYRKQGRSLGGEAEKVM